MTMKSSFNTPQAFQMMMEMQWQEGNINTWCLITTRERHAHCWAFMFEWCLLLRNVFLFLLHKRFTDSTQSWNLWLFMLHFLPKLTVKKIPRQDHFLMCFYWTHDWYHGVVCMRNFCCNFFWLTEIFHEIFIFHENKSPYK